MNYNAYQDDVDVVDFVTWMTPFVTGERRIAHQWHSPRFKSWSCSSLFDAYESYHWPFSVLLPGHKDSTSGSDFACSVSVFNSLSQMLRVSAAREDHNAFVDAVMAVMAWGGLRQSWRGLEAKRDVLMPSVLAAAGQLEPPRADTGRLGAVTYMNSGFSKVYALLLDDFPIYDSRVACALGSFVARYCEERQLKAVPGTLAFGIPASRSTTRDPSRDSFHFPKLWYGQARTYAISNLKAAWLLRLLGDIGPFGHLPSGERVLAIQSAFFMLGYTNIRDEAFE